MSILNDFESTSGGPIWNPVKKGKGAEEVIFGVNDKSFMVGWYLGTRHGVGKHESQVHEFKVKQVGNEDHIHGEATDSGKVSVWGSGVLDDEISKNGIQVGQCVAVQYLGIPNGKKYHNWKLLVPTDMTKYPPLSMSEIGSVATPVQSDQQAAKQDQQSEVPVSAASVMEADDDDLPF
jgi:hypothetical protein